MTIDPYTCLEAAIKAEAPGIERRVSEEDMRTIAGVADRLALDGITAETVICACHGRYAGPACENGDCGLVTLGDLIESYS